MSKHELTKKIYPFAVYEESRVDSIIRTYLEEKAKRAKNNGYIPVDPSTNPTIREIFGLESPEGESENIHNDCNPNELCSHPKEPKQEVWCEHICMSPIHTDKRKHHMKGRGFYVDDDWNYCPVCLAPRPQKKAEKSLEEKFYPIISKLLLRVSEYEYSKFHNVKPVDVGLTEVQAVDQLVQICKEHFRRDK